MVCGAMPRRSQAISAFRDLDEVFTLRIPKQMQKVADEPELDSVTCLLGVRRLFRFDGDWEMYLMTTKTHTKHLDQPRAARDARVPPTHAGAA
jgi:hypothetical protein